MDTKLEWLLVLFAEERKIFYKTLSLLATTPPLSLPMKNEVACNYIHALFGLRDKHITMIRTSFLYQFLALTRSIKIYHKDLTNDVRRGRIKEDLDISETLRAEVNAHLSPMPQRAAELEIEFEKGFDGFFKRIWPDVTRVSDAGREAQTRCTTRKPRTSWVPASPS